MKTPTRERLAEKLATSIYEDIASPLFKLRERAAGVFRGLRITPVMTVDPEGSLGFSFQSGHVAEDVNATLEHLLELPAALGAERGRRVALVFDEFQEIVEIDSNLLPLMRSVFQEQPDVSHVYLGSKRHMMQRIFNDENEPFWRSAKQMELGVIPPRAFARFLVSRFEQTARAIEEPIVELILQATHCHPYGTQELAYAVWEVTSQGTTAARPQFNEALTRVLRSENAHFSRIWERAARAQRLVLEAFAADPGQPALSNAYRRAHALPGTSTVQRAIQALVNDELVERHGSGYRIAEPFLAEWILRHDV
jgi:hypothetical protein